MPPKMPAAASANPLLPPGMPQMDPQMLGQLMAYVPSIIAFAQRIPVMGMGFVLGLFLWMIVMPLVGPSLFLESANSNSNDLSLSGAQSTASSWLPSLFGGASSEGAVEWDEHIEKASSKTKNSKKTQQAGKNSKSQQLDFEEEEEEVDEDEADEVADGSNKNIQAALSTRVRFQRCYLKRGSVIACMREVDNVLAHFFAAMVLAAFLSDGIASRFLEWRADRDQHSRAMGVVEDALVMERMVSLD